MTYTLTRKINGKTVEYGTYKTREDSLPVRERLEECNWDKNRLEEIREEFAIQMNNKRRHKVYRHINHSKGGYSIIRMEDGKRINYGTSRNLINTLYERDALLDSNWDVDLWVEHTDKYTYIPELLPELEINKRRKGQKYITRTRKGQYRVTAKMKDLGKLKMVGLYPTLGEAQQVSVIVQRNNCNWEKTLRELDSRGIKHSIQHDSERKYLTVKKDKIYVAKSINGRQLNYGPFTDTNDAMTCRDHLVETNWRATPLPQRKK